MSNVVPIRQNMKAQVSPTFRAAWDAFPQQGRLRSSQKQAWPEWLKAVKECGSEDELLARVQRYTADDKDYRKECGPPGFHRWLKWGRWEHWAPVTVAPVEARQRVFPDKALRASFFLRFPDEKARQWFDRCTLDGDEIVGPLALARQEWLAGPFKQWAMDNSIGGMRSA